MPERSSLNDRPPAMVKCSVIIVSFNQFDLLKAAIESLKKNPPPFACEIIVVDNHSETDVQEFLNDYFHDIRMIRNHSNQGFGWANNRGFAAAKGEYVLFLNSDAEVMGTAVAAMVEVMEKDPQIGVLGPTLLHADGSFQLSYGRKISLCGEFYQKIMAPRLEKWKYSWRQGRSGVSKTDWVSGACLMLRRELFAKQLPFDENMFLYFEDHDLCLRVRAMGKKVVYYQGARVLHHGGRSMAAAPGTVFQYRKSQLYLYQKQRKFVSLFLLKKYLKWKYMAKLKRASLTDSETSQDEKKACQEILTLL